MCLFYVYKSVCPCFLVSTAAFVFTTMLFLVHNSFAACFYVTLKPPMGFLYIHMYIPEMEINCDCTEFRFV